MSANREPVAERKLRIGKMTPRFGRCHRRFMPGSAGERYPRIGGRPPMLGRLPVFSRAPLQQDEATRVAARQIVRIFDPCTVDAVR